MSEYISARPRPDKITNTKWLWGPDKIPQGGLVVIIGEEDKGKGYFSTHLISKLTNGLLEGVFYGKPPKVEIVAYEDDQAELDKRLLAANADLSLISYLQKEDGSIPNLQHETEAVIEHWYEGGIRVVDIDQLLDHLGLADTGKQIEIRQVLTQFHALLVKRRITAIAKMHPNKKGETARARLSGSAALWQPCRSAFYLADHPWNEGVKVLINTKNNRARQKAKTVEFEILDAPEDFRVKGRRIRSGVVHVLTDNSPIAEEDVLGNGNRGASTERTSELDDRLRTLLSANDPVPYPEIKRDEYFGTFSFKAQKRSLERIGGKVSSHAPGLPSVWSLPRAHDARHQRP